MQSSKHFGRERQSRGETRGGVWGTASPVHPQTVPGHSFCASVTHSNSHPDVEHTHLFQLSVNYFVSNGKGSDSGIQAWITDSCVGVVRSAGGETRGQTEGLSV